MMTGRISRSLGGAVVAALGVLAAGCGAANTPPDGDVIFRDDFTGSLEAGWSQQGGDADQFSLTARSGFLQIAPNPPPTSGEAAQFAVISRQVSGDFVVLTHMVFDPTADRQLAGLVAAGDDDRTVSFGLLVAALDTGDFHGLSAVAEKTGGADPAVAFRSLPDEDLLLQMKRTGDSFQLSYSTDGTNFFVVANMASDLSNNVRVGVGNIVRENCKTDCDAGSGADFDFFEIRRAAAGG